MRFTVGWIVVVFLQLTLNHLAAAQTTSPLTPLHLEHDPLVTQAPLYPGLADAQCDSSDTVYVHYLTRIGSSFSFASGVTKIASDGSVESIAIAGLPGDGPVHVFQFAVGEDGSLHEIVRAKNPDNPSAPSAVYYVTFDSDGTFHSMEPFEQEFIPSVLLPLPNGDFFAAGVVLREKDDNVEERSLAGIFGPDARLKRSLSQRSDKATSSSSSQDDSDSRGDPYSQGVVGLGSDGNIYLLRDGDQPTIKVVTQTGLIQRELKLANPFGAGVANGIWVSGSRILVSYEGEADNPRDAHIYGVYDAQTGATLRLYKPDFSGTLGCFDAGQSLTVLMPQPGTSAVEVGEAELP